MAAAPQGAGMDKAAMKKLLSVSKKEPVNCAIAAGVDPGVGLLLLDKVKQPQALEKLLVKDFPDAKNPRRGTAFVDLDDDPKLVKFRINKPASGIARRLVKTLKGTGFSKVVIVLEDDTFVEAAGGEEEEEGGKDRQGTASAPGEAAAAAEPTPAAPLDAGQLAQNLTASVKRIQGVTDPARKAQLAKLAAGVQASLKGGDLAGAQRALQGLAGALDGGAGAETGTSGTEGDTASGAVAARLQKSRQIWLATTAKVRSDVERLRGEILTSFPDQANELDQEFRAVFQPMLAALDGEVVAALDAAISASGTAAGSGEQRATLMQDVKDATARQQYAINVSPLLGYVDNNPFVPLSSREFMMKTLGTISKSLG